MKIWITGCAGFLGRRLAQAFTESGDEVVGLSRRSCTDVAESVVVDLSTNGAVQVIRDRAASSGAPEVLIHAASRQPGSGSLGDFVRANVHTSFNLLQGLSECPPKQVIYTSTLSVYGPGLSSPVSENAPAVAPQPYPASKRWAEEVMQCWKGCQVTVLRMPSLYGRGQADSFIDGLARLAIRGEPLELYSRGEVVRDALHVSDIVSAIQSCINEPPSVQFSLMNLGCGRPISTEEYAATLIEALGSPSQLVKSDRMASQHDLWADITLARRTIGFEPAELRQSLEAYANELRA